MILPWFSVLRLKMVNNISFPGQNACPDNVKIKKMNSEKIDVLISENTNIRSELIMMSKTVHSCIFAFISSFGLFIGVVINLNINKSYITDYQIGILSFIVSQIEIIIIIYSMMLSADIFTKSAYMSHIESKINSLLSDKLIFWETDVSPFQWKKGALIFSQMFLNLFYLIVFAVFIACCYKYVGNSIYIWVQILEIVIVLLLSYQLKNQFSKTKKFINQLNSQYQEELNTVRGPGQEANGQP